MPYCQNCSFHHFILSLIAGGGGGGFSNEIQGLCFIKGIGVFLDYPYDNQIFCAIVFPRFKMTAPLQFNTEEFTIYFFVLFLLAKII